jgi:purine-binding chemotaxis protein CheW
MQAATATQTTQYVTFRLGDETYAFHVSNTREVVDYTSITPIPNTPDWVRGVVNLRGAVIPVLDIKQKFGMSSTQQTTDTCIIVVELAIGHEDHVLGVLADSVQEVFEIERSQIEPAPKFGASISTTYIEGIGHLEDRFFVILDVERVFSSHELETVVEVSRE